MQIVEETAPAKKAYTATLRALKPGKESLLLGLDQRKKIDVIIGRLKKEAMKFQTHKENGFLKVYRLK
ncbi:MAG: hypothetical protein JWP44_4956 [Mucilaginibacter sp.]|nr:hypothetical protein [Mucilaginibacter sp.]